MMPHNPIKNEPNERLSRESTRVRKNIPKDDKFQTELDGTKSAARLKKHTKSLDSETDEELGKIKEDTSEQVSLFDLSASKQKKKDPSVDFSQHEEIAQNTVQKQVPQVVPESSGFLSPMTSNQVEKPHVDTVSKLQEIVEKIIKEIHEIEMKGKTETIVTLNNPPLLKGANLILTSFDSAKKEFNIAFENLTQPAKTFLDSNNHLDILKMHLEQKGYIAHIITTTTLVENRVFHPGQPQTRDEEQGQQRQQQQGRQNGKDQQNEKDRQ